MALSCLRIQRSCNKWRCPFIVCCPPREWISHRRAPLRQFSLGASSLEKTVSFFFLILCVKDTTLFTGEPLNLFIICLPRVRGQKMRGFYFPQKQLTVSRRNAQCSANKKLPSVAVLTLKTLLRTA